MTASKIYLVGVFHCVNINDQIEKIINYFDPDEVLIELNDVRYRILDGTFQWENIKFHREIYTKALLNEGAFMGSELYPVIQICERRGINWDFIDMNEKDIEAILEEADIVDRLRLWIKRFLYLFFFSKEKVREQIEKISNNPVYYDYILNSHPNNSNFSFLNKQREKYMAERILEYSDNSDKILVFLGDGHRKKISKKLERNPETFKFRAKEVNFIDFWNSKFP